MEEEQSQNSLTNAECKIIRINLNWKTYQIKVDLNKNHPVLNVFILFTCSTFPAGFMKFSPVLSASVQVDRNDHTHLSFHLD